MATTNKYQFTHDSFTLCLCTTVHYWSYPGSPVLIVSKILTMVVSATKSNRDFNFLEIVWCQKGTDGFRKWQLFWWDFFQLKDWKTETETHTHTLPMGLHTWYKPLVEVETSWHLNFFGRFKTDDQSKFPRILSMNQYVVSRPSKWTLFLTVSLTNV